MPAIDFERFADLQAFLRFARRSDQNLEDRYGECSEWLGDRSRRKDLPFQIDAFKYFKAPIFLLWVHNSAKFQPSGYTFIHFHRSEPQRSLNGASLIFHGVHCIAVYFLFKQ